MYQIRRARCCATQQKTTDEGNLFLSNDPWKAKQQTKDTAKFGKRCRGCARKQGQDENHPSKTLWLKTRGDKNRFGKTCTAENLCKEKKKPRRPKAKMPRCVLWYKMPHLCPKAKAACQVGKEEPSDPANHPHQASPATTS